MAQRHALGRVIYRCGISAQTFDYQDPAPNHPDGLPTLKLSLNSLADCTVSSVENSCWELPTLKPASPTICSSFRQARRMWKN
jgi:hypothetical protein